MYTYQIIHTTFIYFDPRNEVCKNVVHTCSSNSSNYTGIYRVPVLEYYTACTLVVSFIYTVRDSTGTCIINTCNTGTTRDTPNRIYYYGGSREEREKKSIIIIIGL